MFDNRYRDSVEATEILVKVVERSQPRKEEMERYEEYYHVFTEVYHALKKSYARMAELKCCETVPVAPQAPFRTSESPMVLKGSVVPRFTI
jgi:hypothetical protein